MSDERIVVNIDADASGFTRQIARAEARLDTFTARVMAGSKAIGALTTRANASAVGLGKLTSASNTLRTTITALSRSATGLDTKLSKLGGISAKTSTSVNTLGRNAGQAAARIEKMAIAAAEAGASLTSLNVRSQALGKTVSLLNQQMRTLTRSQAAAIATLNRVSAAATGASGAISSAGRSAGRTATRMSLLSKSTHGIAEGFRRGVAQITALRTLTYQALFWFAPLIYSIVKVNAEYEKQMVLLSNMAKATETQAKQQEAIQTRQVLLNMAQTNPFALEAITDSFVKMRVGGVEPLDGALQTLMNSVASFGGDSNSLKRASIAIQQMGGKGVVSMEELRQQLGEHIPTAMQAMADGMGMSMGDMLKQIEKGTVEARNALNLMFASLAVQSEGAARRMMNTWSGLMARLSTAWQQFLIKVSKGPDDGSGGASENSFIGRLKKNIEELIIFLKTPEGEYFARRIQAAMVKVVDMFVTLVQTVYKYRDAVVKIATIFAALWGGRLVLGILGSLIKVFTGLNGIVLKVAMAMRTFAKASSAAAVANAGLAAKTQAGAAAVLGLNTATGRANRLLGIMRLRALAVIGVMGALAVGIWAVVTALNAKNAAEGRAQQLKQAGKEGATWEDGEREKTKKEIDWLKKELDSNKSHDKAGSILGGSTMSAAERKRKQRQYNNLVEGFNLKEENTVTGRNIRVREAMIGRFNEKIDVRMNRMTSEMNAELDGVTDPKERQQIKARYSERMANVTGVYTDYFKEKMEVGGPEGEAYRALYNERLGRQEALAQGAELLENGEMVNIKGEDDGTKKGGGSGPKISQEERARNRWAEKFQNAYANTAELELEWDNIKNNTNVELDREGLELEARRVSTIYDTAEALEMATLREKERQDYIKDAIQVEKAILDIRDKAEQQNIDTAIGFDALDRGYESVIAQSDAYRDSLERQYREELAIIEARKADGVATDDEIRQYKELKQAVDDAVRAKEAEMLLDLSSAAKEANKQYDYSFMSRGQVEAAEAQIEIQRYMDGLAMAQSQRSTLQADLDREVEAYRVINAELTTAREIKAENVDELEKEAIVIQGNTEKLQAQVDLHDRSIPYIQRRIDILNQEMALREKMGGMGYELSLWARQANADFEDLGGTMGGVMVNAITGFVDSLIEGKAKFADFIKVILEGLLKVILQGLIAKAILSALGLSTSVNIPAGEAAYGVSGSTGIYHSGGIVGSPRITRNVDSSTFAFAQRYHTGGIVGLGPNEVPIIAEKGEGVFTKEQMATMNNGNNTNNVEVNVINQTGTDAEVERQPAKFDGEKWVENIILKKMSRPGPIRDAMRGAR